MSLLAEVCPIGPNSSYANSGARIDSSSEELHFTRSALMRDLYDQIEKVATVDVPVLFLGESGVGKEYLAKFLHRLSHRSRRPFLKVNCAALPTELLESELFGYEAGAFTGATRFKPGQFDLCDQGTILLDEIAEMSPAMQAKLLHVLQDQQFSRLGGRRMIQVNVRVLAATNVDINEALAQKIFRADLYYRLNTIILSVPPLRDRCEDIPLLLDHFIIATAAQFGMPPRTISQRLLQACLQYSWPGNVRELQSFVCRFLLLGDDEALMAELHETRPEDLVTPESGEKSTPYGLGLKSLGRNIRAHAEKRMIEEALAKTCWNRTEAARQLQISCKSLRNKIRQYGISALVQTPQPADEHLREAELRQDALLNSKNKSPNSFPLDGHQPALTRPIPS